MIQPSGRGATSIRFPTSATSTDRSMPGELSTRIAELRAQVKQGLRLLMICAPDASDKGLPLARNPFDMPLAISDRKHKWTARLRTGNRSQGRSTDVLCEMGRSALSFHQPLVQFAD